MHLLGRLCVVGFWVGLALVGGACRASSIITHPEAELQCQDHEEPHCSACLQGETQRCLALVSSYEGAAERPRDLKRASLFWTLSSQQLKPRCQQGEALACATLGARLWDGLITPREPQKAKEYLSRASMLYQLFCEANDASGCLALASLYQHNGNRSLRQVMPLYERAIQLGESAAWMLMKQFYTKHQPGVPFEGVSKPTSLSSPLLEEKCEAKDFSSCRLLSAFYRELGAVKEARELSLKTCERKDADSCYEVGAELARTGDFGGALPLLQRGCALGSSRGCSSLISLAANSTSALDKAASAQALIDAQQLWWRSCTWEEEESCKALLEMYTRKLIVGEARVVDIWEVYQKRLSIYRIECEARVSQSCLLLAGAISRGDPYGAKLARSTAANLFQNGCAQEDSDDCYRYANLLLPRETERALELLQTSCQLGTLKACEQLTSTFAFGMSAPKDQAKSDYFSCLACRLRPFGSCPSLCEEPLKP